MAGSPTVLNWFIRASGVAIEIADVVAAGDQVIVSGPPNGPDAGPNIVSYAASPPDLLGADGTPVAAFPDFPITVEL